MKKVLSLLLLMALGLSLCACGANAGTSPTQNTTEAKPQTALEQLSEGEKAIFTAITSMTAKDTDLDLTSIRVLEIGNLEVRTDQDPDTILYGPDTVVVNLQGSNGSGGTETQRCLICVKGATNTTESAVSLAESEKRIIESANSIGDTYTVQQSKHDLMRYEAKAGDYAMYADPIKTDSSDTYDIGKINRALEEYWNEKGF